MKTFDFADDGDARLLLPAPIEPIRQGTAPRA